MTILNILFFSILQISLGINSYFKKKKKLRLFWSGGFWLVDFDQVDFDSGWFWTGLILIGWILTRVDFDRVDFELGGFWSDEFWTRLILIGWILSRVGFDLVGFDRVDFDRVDFERVPGIYTRLLKFSKFYSDVIIQNCSTILNNFKRNIFTLLSYYHTKLNGFVNLFIV